MKIFNQMNTLLKFITVGLGLSFLISCDDNLIEKPEPNTDIVGITQVALDANKVVIRGEEALLGNVVADAMLYYADQNGIDVDVALANGGGIRFTSSSHPDGIYPAGNLTVQDISEILPFGGGSVVLTMTGAELMSTLERGVFGLPIPEGDSGAGAFLQVSSTLEIDVNLQNPAQVLGTDENDDDIIVSEGTRITFAKVKGQTLDLNGTYKVMTGGFPASGGDGFVTMGSIADSLKMDIEEEADEILRQYVEANSPIAPTIEGRIEVFE